MSLGVITRNQNMKEKQNNVTWIQTVLWYT